MKIKSYSETHMRGSLMIEKKMSSSLISNVDFGVQIAEDGRVWICLDGEAFLRFLPERKIEK